MTVLLALGTLLDKMGAPEWAIVLVSGSILLWHGRSALLLASKAATVVKVIGVLGLLLAAASAGLVPGLGVIVDPFRIASWAGDLGGDVWGVIQEVTL